MKLTGVQEKEKTAETTQSAASPAPVVIQEQCELKNINATTEQDSSDQDDKGKSDNDKSDADGKMCNEEQQQVSFGFEESERVTSSLEATDGSENTGVATANFEVASPDPTSLSHNQMDLKFDQILVLIKLLEFLSRFQHGRFQFSFRIFKD